jgi:probable rRNA maturation factor
MIYCAHKRFLEKVAEKTLRSLPRASLDLARDEKISIVLVGDAKIKALNKKYRKSNKVTDVLAFDYGEIFICLSQAKKQAKKLGHSLKEELAILLIHGILHLTGYKDKTKKDLNKMLKKQREICQKII